MPPSATRTDQQQAHSLATNIQLAGKLENRPADPNAVRHTEQQYRLHVVARNAPAARTAWALLTLHQVHPVPLSRDLTPAGDPLTTVDAILDFGWKHDHGIGLATGPHPTRDWTYLAVKVDRFGAWNEWLKAQAKTTRKIGNFGGWANLGRGRTAETGPPIEQERHRHPGAFTRLLWSPPPLPSGRVYHMDATGGELLASMEEQRQGRGGWIWAVIDGRHDVKARKLTEGIDVVPDGTVIPWTGSLDPDGWRLAIEAPMHTGDGLRPSREPVADWLTDKLTSSRRR